MAAKRRCVSSANRRADATPAERMSFPSLVAAIRQMHEQCAAQVNRAVNVSLTLRNWMIGGYIYHYELHGSDRAAYGEELIDRLAAELNRQKVTACDPPRLYGYLALFRVYPQIKDAIPLNALPAGGCLLLADSLPILRSVTGECSQSAGNEIVRSVTGQMLVEKACFALKRDGPESVPKGRP